MSDFPSLYNSPLEAGIRSVIVLEHLRPECADLSEMVLFDYAVVHSWDLGGPRSLHADVPGKRGELLVRRRLVEAGLDLMRRSHLVVKCEDKMGFVWRASDEAAAYTDLLETKYSEHLKLCAKWLSQQVDSLSKEGFKEFAKGKIGEWSEAFGDDAERPSAGA